MAALPAEKTVQELEERIGPLYDLAALAGYCQVGRPVLRRALQRAGVPVIEVGRKQLVPREIADKALGLDFAEVILEIYRNQEWIRRQEYAGDGRRLTVGEYAEKMSRMARRALKATPRPEAR